MVLYVVRINLYGKIPKTFLFLPPKTHRSKTDKIYFF